MQITSPAYNDKQIIPEKYTCVGEGINPELKFGDIPPGTESLVLILDDPDAPVSTFTHWVLYNIPPETTGIRENSLPEGARTGLNSLGKDGYVAPCPPNGMHRYIITLYALDRELLIEGDPTPDVLQKYMAGHILAEAKLSGVFAK